MAWSRSSLSPCQSGTMVPAVMAAGYTVAPTEATFPAGAPRARIDFVAVSGLEVVAASTPAVGISDHLPVVADLRTS